jgi:glycosyltransferase involved in cell wall biosynthesis
MGELPVVAVVMAVRDVEEFVVQTLRSLQAQTEERWAAFVVDDASTDATIATVEALDDPRIQVVRRDRSGGSGAARNLGLRHVPGHVEFVAFLDGDDTWEPDALEQLVAALRARPDAVGVYGLAEYIDREGVVLRPGEHPRLQRARRRVRGWDLEDVPDDEDTTFDSLVVAGTIWPAAVALHRTAIVRRVGGFDEALRLQQDWDLYVRMSRHGPFATLDRQVAWYRQHGGNVTHREVEKLYFQDAVRLKSWASPANSAPQRRLAGRAWRALHHRDLARTAIGSARALAGGRVRDAGRGLVATAARAAQLVGGAPRTPDRRLIAMGLAARDDSPWDHTGSPRRP